MFDNFPEWLGLIIAAAAVIGMVAGAFAFFKASAGDRTLKLAAQEIDLLNQRDVRRTTEFELLVTKFEGCKSQLVSQSETIALLTDTVTGASAVKKLADQLRKYHKEMIEEHRELVKTLNGGTKARGRTR